ncbi:MAG: DUF808 domain-containing protein [Nitrosomonas sp.]|nr:DUF808 domain-containing protein [Nitrosomonas sp.]
MATANLFALLDDIASVLDDVAVLSKLAAKKTAGVLGDDLALNAQQVMGIQANREIPVVWAVAKGSFWNKAILVPAALLISALLPWAITPLLMIGGTYLCYEGFEKLAHRFLHSATEETTHKNALSEALANPTIDLVAYERDKIKGAIRTDFILSAEIIVIALGIVANETLITRIGVLIATALTMTLAVYGLVAAIIKLDDLGFWLQKKGIAVLAVIGQFLLSATPWLMRFLSVAGTVAMFLVGGNILIHGVPSLTHWIEIITSSMDSLSALVISSLSNILLGIVCGGLMLGIVHIIKKIKS